MAGTKKSATKDLSPKTATVKGGRAVQGTGGQHNVTLVRAAKPGKKTKDLPTRKPIKGGAIKKNVDM